MKNGKMSVEGVARRHSKRIWFVVLGVFVSVFLFSFLVQRYKGDGEVDAASLAGFDPGYIISDYQMGNYNSMSEGDIQAFLTSKNSCGNTNYGYYAALSSNPNYRWHFENGHFICLSEERFGHNDNEIGFQYGESAAHIIWQAAQDYRINPQVLLVLLQKETGLITDPIPNNGDYRKATGYGCPDTAACSSQYYGFRNQVRNAAALFRTVLDGGWTNYPLGNNYIQYNPNAACGGSVVNVRSLATSALYRYTPYQPNVGALAAGYGTASCGAYGNRNFYLYFQDWFGGITDTYREIIVEAQTKYARMVADGTYQIVSKASPDKSIDIRGGVYEGMAAGGLLQIYPTKTSNRENQLFRIEYDKSTGFYSITNPTAKMSVDVKGASTEDKTHTQVYPSHDRCNQDWLFEQDGEGYYTIISRCSGKVLDAALSSSFVNIFTGHDGDNQKWRLVKVEEESIIDTDGTYQIVSKASPDKSIDIRGGVYEGMAAGGLLQIYPTKTSNRENQLFRIEYDKSTGFYSITNPTAKMSVDVKGASTEDKTHTQVYPSHDRCNQDWLFEQDGEGYYTIISRCSGKVLDAALSSSFVNIFTGHDGDNQKWRLVKG